MSAYDQVLKFLQVNEGKKMKVGIHAYNLASYTTFENWVIDGNADFDINIADDDNLVTIVHDEDIHDFTTNSAKMNIYPDTGHFELYTEYGTICFKLL